MNLTYLGLCLACFGVSLAEGMIMSNLFKAASRQPEIIGQLRSLLILGVAFVEGTFFVTLVMAFIIKQTLLFQKRRCQTLEESINPTITLGPVSFNLTLLAMTLISVFAVFGFIYWASRKMSIRPKGKQNVLEYAYDR